MNDLSVELPKSSTS